MAPLPKNTASRGDFGHKRFRFVEFVLRFKTHGLFYFDSNWVQFIVLFFGTGTTLGLMLVMAAGL